MKALPPCDHDECPPTRCIQNANAKGVGFSELVSRLRGLSNTKHGEADALYESRKLDDAYGRRCFANGLDEAIKIIEAANVPNSATGDRGASPAKADGKA